MLIMPTQHPPSHAPCVRRRPKVARCFACEQKATAAVVRRPCDFDVSPGHVDFGRRAVAGQLNQSCVNSGANFNHAERPL